MIYKCACGNIKRGPQQPFRASGVKAWTCNECRLRVVRATMVLRRTIPNIGKVIVFERRTVIGGLIHGLLG